MKYAYELTQMKQEDEQVFADLKMLTHGLMGLGLTQSQVVAATMDRYATTFNFLAWFSKRDIEIGRAHV